MERISPKDTREISLSAKPDLCDEELKIIFELSAGHPLALIYILREIQPIEDTQLRLKILKTQTNYTGNIDEQYYVHWEQISKEKDLVYTFGLLCRIRGWIPLQWVASWATNETLEKLQKYLTIYFHEEYENNWAFFHNSFRLFLISQTSKSLPGKSIFQQKTNYHNDLASKYKNSQSPYSWETL